MVDYKGKQEHGGRSRLHVVPEIIVGLHEAERTAKSDSAQYVQGKESRDQSKVQCLTIRVAVTDQSEHVVDSAVDVRFQGGDITAIVLCSSLDMGQNWPKTSLSLHLRSPWLGAPRDASHLGWRRPSRAWDLASCRRTTLNAAIGMRVHSCAGRHRHPL